MAKCGEWQWPTHTETLFILILESINFTFEQVLTGAGTTTGPTSLFDLVVLFIILVDIATCVC